MEQTGGEKYFRWAMGPCSSSIAWPRRKGLSVSDTNKKKRLRPNDKIRYPKNSENRLQIIWMFTV